MLNTDKAWEKWGQNDPYYGVLTDDNFRKVNLNADKKRAFFESGEEHIKFIIDIINRHIDPAFTPSICLDFGCGVGRLVIPLAKRYKNVIGVDVSDSMLEEARKNCLENEISNASFYKSDDNISSLNSKFDLIHSCLVFQHIPTKRGKLILKRLLDLLNEGGIAVIQIPFYRDAQPLREFICWLQKKVPFLANIVNLFRGRKFLQPPMQMNTYNLTEIIKLLDNQGILKIFAIIYSDAKYHNMFIFGSKTSGTESK